MSILAKFSFRHVLGRPLRALLTLLSVIIGVATVVAVTLATGNTRRAYYELFSAVTGRTALEIVAEGGGTFEQQVLAQVESVPGVKVAAPLLHRETILFFNRQGEKRRVTLFLLGVDPKRDAAIRSCTLADGRMPSANESGVLLESEFARNLGAQVGDTVGLLTGKVVDAKVVGLLDLEGAEALRSAGMIFVPLAKAQTWFRAPGEIDAIHIVLEEGAQEKKVQGAIAALLPQGLTCHPPTARSQVMDEMLKGSEMALLLATAFALLLAAFIILNTFLMNVGERRQQLAVLRTVGATRPQIALAVLGESLVLGLLGTVVGVPAGVAGAAGLSWAISAMMNSPTAPLQITWTALAAATAIGPLLAMIGGAIPAVRAAHASPLEALRVSAGDGHRSRHWHQVLGVVLILASAVPMALAIFALLPFPVAVGSAVVMLLGTMLLMPLLLTPLSLLMATLLVPLAKVEGRLARRQVLRHRGRSTLTVGVLFVAIATGLGMTNAILDSSNDVRVWYQRTLNADFIVRATNPDLTRAVGPNVPAEFDDEIRRVPGIVQIDAGKFVHATIAGESAVVIARDFQPGKPLNLDLRGSDEAEVQRRLAEGGLIVSTVLAQRTKLRVGDTADVATREGVRRLEVAATTNEYLASGLVVYMDRELARRLLKIEGIDGYMIKAQPEARDAARKQIQALCDKHGVLLHSYGDLARMIEGMIGSIDGALWAIIVLCFVVAAIGVVNTLTMNVLEQTRELGLLRIVAMTRGQVRATILTQAVIMGGIGLGPGTVIAILVSYLLHLAMLPIFGHPVAFVLRPAMFGISLAAGMAIVLAAAWLPAERAARLDLTKALQYE